MFLNLLTYIDKLNMRQRKDYTVIIGDISATALKMKRLHL